MTRKLDPIMPVEAFVKIMVRLQVKFILSYYYYYVLFYYIYPDSEREKYILLVSNKNSYIWEIIAICTWHFIFSQRIYFGSVAVRNQTCI